MANINTGGVTSENPFNVNWTNNSKNNAALNNVSEKDTCQTQKTEFSDTVKGIDKFISNVDELQQSSDVSIVDLLSGNNADVTSVVSEVAKADVSFKLLVGVRNKLIEAYKQTMNMPV